MAKVGQRERCARRRKVAKVGQREWRARRRQEINGGAAKVAMEL